MAATRAQPTARSRTCSPVRGASVISPSASTHTRTVLPAVRAGSTSVFAVRACPRGSVKRTVIGYSAFFASSDPGSGCRGVNDSVVVFDRVRELGRGDRRTPFDRVANQALLQTLPRTVNTGMGASFILTALAVLGGDTLTDFALALLIGLAVGTYSSMFTATPLAIELHRRT